jgi:DNA-binding SARP family transcriptional activator/Flp pilus assembly protein TadD
MTDLRIQLLGGFRIEVNGHGVPDKAWGRPAAKKLVKLLALAPGHLLHKEEVQDLLWGNLGPETVDASFRRALHLARHALEPNLPRRASSRFLVVRDGLVSLDLETCLVDADFFDSEARSALEADDVTLLERAVEAYTGDLLPEDKYEEWSQARRGQLAMLHVMSLLRYAARLLESGRLDRGEVYLERAITQDPGCEDAYRLLMRCIAEQGDRGRAIQTYGRCRLALQEEIGAAPDSQTEAVLRQIEAGELEVRTSHVAQGKDTAGVARLHFPELPLRDVDRTTVGRTEELASISDWIRTRQGAQPGGPPLLVIRGEMGVGKTHLANAVAVGAQGGGAAVLWGSWSEYEAGIPYGAFGEAIERVLAANPGSQATCTSYPELHNIAPSVAFDRSGAPANGDPESRRAQLFSSVARFFGDLEGTSPLLVVLDDLGAADDASRELLAYLVRLSRQRRRAYLATLRSDMVNSALAGYLAEMERAGLGTLLDLNPLAEEAARDLARAVSTEMDEGQLEAVWRVSAGNPLYTVELARHAADNSGGKDDSLPDTLTSLILHRLSRLPAEQQEVATAGSVMGDRWTLTQMDRQLGAYERRRHTHELIAALEGLSRAGLIHERAGQYGFVHPVYQRALYQSLSSDRARILHQAAAAALVELRPTDVDSLALQFSRAGDRPAAINYLEAAGDQAAAVYANDAAEQRFGAALELVDAHEDRRRLQAKLATVLLTKGKLAQAERVLDEALTSSPETVLPPAIEGDLLATLGRVLRAQGRASEAIPRLEAFPRRLGDLPAGVVANVKGVLARLLFVVGRHDESISTVEEAMRLAEAEGNWAVYADAAVAHATALLAVGELDRGREALLQALPTVEEGGDLNLFQVALANLAEVYGLNGDLRRSLEFHRRAFEIVRKMGDPHRLGFAHSAVGVSLMALGQWQEARVHLESARDLAANAELAGEQSWHAPYIRIHLGRLEAFTGNPSSAETHLHKAYELAVAGQDVQAKRFVAAGLADCDVMAGRYREAFGRLQESLGEGDTGDMDEISLMPLLAIAQLGIGDSEGAVRTARDAAVRAEAAGAVTEVKEALISLGRGLASMGDFAGASAELETALEMADTMGDLYAQARTHAALANVDAGWGKIAQAERHRKAATKLLRRLGARLDPGLSRGYPKTPLRRSHNPVGAMSNPSGETA